MSAKKKQPMRNKQLSCIWAMAKSLGINSEYLHVLVFSITGKESLSTLSPKESMSVVDHLKKEQAKQNKTNSKLESEKNVWRLPTPQQRYFMQKLLSDVTKILSLQNPNAYLESISKRMFGKLPGKLDRKEFGNLIKQLKQITTATKKAVNE